MSVHIKQVSEGRIISLTHTPPRTTTDTHRPTWTNENFCLRRIQKMHSVVKMDIKLTN